MSYTYNGNNMLARKTDAKGQRQLFIRWRQSPDLGHWANAPGGAQVLRFGGSNTQEQVGTLLHELGHAMKFVFGPNTNNFDQSGKGNPGTSSWNDLLIANCLK